MASRDSLEAMASFVDRHDLDDVVNIADLSGEVWNRFGVFGQPTWGFVNGDTGEVTVAFGALGAAGVEAAFSSRSLR